VAEKRDPYSRVDNGDNDRDQLIDQYPKRRLDVKLHKSLLSNTRHIIDNPATFEQYFDCIMYNYILFLPLLVHLLSPTPLAIAFQSKRIPVQVSDPKELFSTNASRNPFVLSLNF
jgi:hypothetical protein